MDALLSLRNVSLTFSRGRRHVVRVLADASLDVYPGEMVAVLAQRAQGKTTLLRAAAGIDRPTHGEVLFKGQDLCGLSDQRLSELLSRAIAFVEPLGELDLPVIAHVAVPLLARCNESEAYARARATLHRVGADEYADQSWSSLADSERALAALAQGLVRQPELLLIDDLMATLGIDATEQIGRTLNTIAHEDRIAVLMSASDVHATTWFDRITTLAGGCLLVPPHPEPGYNVIDFPADKSRLTQDLPDGPGRSQTV
ncbi:MAG: ATP-binding cassette domain-containing protein [Solirubrobacteraceae bacterium]